MMPTIDDALTAADRLAASRRFECDPELSVIVTCLDSLKAHSMPTAPGHAGRDWVIVEGALQHGFDWIDDSGELLIVSQEKLMQYVSIYREDCAAKARPAWLDGFQHGVMLGIFAGGVVAALALSAVMP